MALPFLTLYLTEEHHYSESRAGLAVASYGLAGFLTAPWAGRLTDTVGPVRLMFWALIFSGTLMLIVPFMPGYWLVVAAVVVWAIFNEAVRPAGVALLTDAVPVENKRSAITLYRTSVNLGMSAGPALGGLLATLSYFWVFSVDAVTSFLAALFLGWSMRSMPPHVPEPGHGENLALRDRRLWLYLVATLPVMVVFFQHTSTMPLFMVRNLHLPPSAYGLLFTLNTALVLTLEIPLSSYTSRWPYRVSLSLGALLVSCGFGALSLCTGLRSIAATVVVWTCGEMLLLPAAAAYVSDLAPPGKTGQYIGMFSAVLSISMVLGPSIGAAVLQHYGPTVLWTGGLAIGTISTVLLAAL
jgi:predicted MFS family arabinose efflux permease